MPNRQRQPVSYRPFRTEPLLADGLLAVSRADGSLLERTSQALFNFAEQQGQIADQETADRFARASRQAIMDGGPSADVSVTGGEAAGGNSHEVAAGILRKEEGFRETPYWDVNAYRTGYGSDTITDASGKKHKVAKGMRITRDDAERDLARRLGEFEQVAMGQAGAENWGKLPAATRGALLSVAYNYGSLPKSVVSAIRGGGDVASAVEGLSANRSRRSREAAIIRGAGVAPDPSSMSVSATGGTWRPMEGNTVAARAWNEAGTKLYLQTLDTQAMSGMQKAYDLYKDNPADLEVALGAVKDAISSKSVFPEIAPEFAMSFDRRAMSYMAQARESLAVRQASEAKAGLFERTVTIETEALRQVDDIDPSNPQAADALASSLTALDTSYDSAAEMGYITSEAAATAKAASRRKLATSFYLKQAERLGADEVSTLRSSMADDFRSGKLAGIDGDGWLSLDAKLQALEQGKRSDAAAGRSRLEATGKAFATRAQLGYGIDPNSYNDFLLAAGESQEGTAIADETRRKIEAAQAVRNLPLPEGSAYVEALRKHMGAAPSDADIAVLEFAEKTMATREKALAEDPLAEAARIGAVEVAPIDTSTPEGLESSMSARQQAAQSAAVHLGVPVEFFQPEEVKSTKADIKSIDPARHASAMKKLDYVAGTSSLAEVQRVFGDDGVSALQDWQARLRYETPENVAAWLKDRADPKWQERVKPLVTKGENEARKVSFDAIVAKLDENTFFDVNVPIDAETRRMVMNDFVMLSGERYVASQDAGKSQEQAIDAMRRFWGTTSVYGSRGGRLMFYPPEEQPAYPVIDGSRQWIADELASYATEKGVDLANLSLVADAKTKYEADSGKAPGYLVSVLDPATGLDGLLTDAAGRPLRHYFDPAAAADKAMTKALEQRRTRNDPWLILNEGTSIGPFYPPWSPPSAADKAERRQRIREIVRKTLPDIKAFEAERARPVEREETLDNFLDGDPLTGRK